MVELDEMLSVIENPARRQILEALVREPHYALQLSKELGMSQQAIVKHLRVMESCGLVESFQEESDLGGPMRKRYFPALNFTIVVDSGPNLFRAWVRTREAPERAHEPEEASGTADLRERMAAIDQELEELEAKRCELMQAKARVLEEAARVAAREDDYLVRRVMYEFISRPDLGPRDIAQELDVRDEVVLKLLSGLLDDEPE